jgi:hypothetical protein
METQTYIEWTRTGDEWTEPSGRFRIIGLNRRYELQDATQNPPTVMKRAGKAECFAKAEELAGAVAALAVATDGGFADTVTVDDLRAEEINDPFIAEEMAAAVPEPEPTVEEETIAEEELAVELALQREVTDVAPQAPARTAAAQSAIQSKIDALVSEWGDFRHLPSRDKVVKKAGLTPEDVTDAAIEHGMRRMSEKWRERTREVNADPTQILKIVNIGDPESDPQARLATPEKTSKLSESKPVNVISERKGKQMKTLFVDEAEARELLQDVGYAASDAVDIDKTIKRLNRLDTLEKDNIADATNRKLVKLILDALESGQKIDVGAEKDEPESNGVVKPAKQKKAKAAKPVKAVKVIKKAKASTAGGKKHTVKVGTIIDRIYKDKTYKVEALEDGFKCSNKKYSSLTALAKHITGQASINGPKFFDLV